MSTINKRALPKPIPMSSSSSSSSDSKQTLTNDCIDQKKYAKNIFKYYKFPEGSTVNGIFTRPTMSNVDIIVFRYNLTTSSNLQIKVYEVESGEQLYQIRIYPDSTISNDFVAVTDSEHTNFAYIIPFQKTWPTGKKLKISFTCDDKLPAHYVFKTFPAFFSMHIQGDSVLSKKVSHHTWGSMSDVWTPQTMKAKFERAYKEQDYLPDFENEVFGHNEKRTYDIFKTQSGVDRFLMHGKVNVTPLALESKNKRPKKRKRKEGEEEDEDDDGGWRCSVCFGDSTERWLTAVCGHTYCHQCISKMDECPKCRKKYKTPIKLYD